LSEHRKNTDRRTMTMREWVYPPVIRMALALFRILGVRFDLRGLDNIPASGGAVLASNHVSYLDFMFVGLPAHRGRRRLVRFMAKKAVFDHPVSGPLMRGMHHIPVDRLAGAAAYKHALAALRDGELVGVFPEQTISRSFLPRPLKNGAARLALESGVPLIPVVVWGGQRIWTSGRKPAWRRNVAVSVWIDEPLSAVPGETAAELTGRLAARLHELVQEVLGEYPDRPVVGDEWWLPAHVGGSAPTPEQAAAIELERIHSGKAARSEQAS
jgi:1-acyl-sn-glycerol-3-phosphate acyltransferase